LNADAINEKYVALTNAVILEDSYALKMDI
jgi:hypothetical protein